VSDITQTGCLQREKKRTIAAIISIGILLMLACIFRFVPLLNDLLAGRPQYAKAMTTLMSYEFGRVAQNRFPVLLLGKNEDCNVIRPAQITEDQIAGILYVLTYSERQRFSCVTSYVVPIDPSKFTNLQTFQPKAQWMSGPQITQPLKVLLFDRNLHVYPPAYLKFLHWRVKPRLPLSKEEGANFAARQYYSPNPNIPSNGHVSMDIDFDKARALVREPHDKANAWLAGTISGLAFGEFCLALLLIRPYKKASKHLSLYKDRLTFLDFLTRDMSQRLSVSQTRYYQQERERKEQECKVNAELNERYDLEERLRFAMSNLQHPQLSQKIEKCLSQPPDLELMKQLWAEAQKMAGFKSPEQKLELLLESLEPLCTEEELNNCRLEAARIMANSGFRGARNYVISMHDDFKARLREIEASEERQTGKRPENN